MEKIREGSTFLHNPGYDADPWPHQWRGSSAALLGKGRRFDLLAG